MLLLMIWLCGERMLSRAIQDLDRSWTAVGTGVVTYLSKLIPNMPRKTTPLHQLIQNDFDPKELLTLSVDASLKGLGAVILQKDRLVAQEP